MDIYAGKAIECPADNSKIVLKGCTGSGKTTMLFERYRYMVEELRIPSDRILVLLLNRARSLEWKEEALLNSSGPIWKTTYYGFIQDEINTYYPLILKNCSDIMLRRIKPVFLRPETSQFLLFKAIEARRESRGVFAAVAADTARIASDLAFNLIKASASGIPCSEIGSRLFNELEKKDEIKKRIFMEADEIIQAYRNKCMELGVFDFAMSLELYNRCLLNHEEYRRNLFKRVQHLIVDNIEECIPAELDFITLLFGNVKTCFLGYNPEAGYGESSDSNHEYLRQNILNKCDIIQLKRPFTCSEQMYEFSSMLFDDIQSPKGGKLRAYKVLEREPAVELRSEMLEKIGERVCRLISEEGYRPSDIMILSTYADPVTEYVIGGILEKKGYRLVNIARKEMAADSPLIHSLITLAQLCHPGFRIMPGKDDISMLIRTMLGIDPVRSSILARKVCSSLPFPELPDVTSPGIPELIGKSGLEAYEHVRRWVNEYKEMDMPLPIDEFFQKCFLEVLASQKITNASIAQVKSFIDGARGFVEAAVHFNRNAGKDFLEAVSNNVKLSDGNMAEAVENPDGDCVLMGTSAVYLASSIRSRVVILAGISSRNWTPRNIKELTNPYVLTRSWDPEEVYTEEMEDSNQRRYLVKIMRSILRRCGDKLITFESELSANGYVNDGILTEFFDEITMV